MIKGANAFFRRKLDSKRVHRYTQKDRMRLFRVHAFFKAAFPVLVLGACAETKPGPKPGLTPSAARTPAAPATGSQAQPVPQAQASKTVDAGPPPPKAPEHFVGAVGLTLPIFSEMEFPKEGSSKKEKSVRLGYIRMGSKAGAEPEPHVKANCQEGWYELTAGGFVCGKYATTDMNHPRLRTSPHVPYTDRPLPYDYGYNVANGTPLYRAVPSRDERMANEPWLSPKKKREEAAAPSDELDGGAPPASTENETAVPWYLKETDGGKPQVTLDDLKGEGPVARRMVKGFFLGLDKPFISGGARWWRTTGLMIAPSDRIMQWKPPTEFHGMWLDGRTSAQSAASDAGAGTETHKAASSVGFVLNGKARKYTLSADQKHVSTGGDLSRFMAFRMTGETATISGRTYWETEDGWWLKDSDGTRSKPGAPPPDLKAGEKWIDVSISLQTLVALEGDKPVYATLISSGRTSPVKDKDHPTPTGTWRIREKHIAATMDGDVASDGPYSIEDVPWIMYFQGSYALHGAFWHGNFGHKQSHGCVNLAPADAKAMFGWSDPQLPEGWHGVNGTQEHPGTWVVVHE
jgi:L,D-transpeptidase catalytic domain